MYSWLFMQYSMVSWHWLARPLIRDKRLLKSSDRERKSWWPDHSPPSDLSLSWLTHLRWSLPKWFISAEYSSTLWRRIGVWGRRTLSWPRENLSTHYTQSPLSDGINAFTRSVLDEVTYLAIILVGWTEYMSNVLRGRKRKERYRDQKRAWANKSGLYQSE